MICGSWCDAGIVCLKKEDLISRIHQCLVSELKEETSDRFLSLGSTRLPLVSTSPSTQKAGSCSVNNKRVHEERAHQSTHRSAPCISWAPTPTCSACPRARAVGTWEEKQANISWVMSTLHPVIAAGHYEALWQTESWRLAAAVVRTNSKRCFLTVPLRLCTKDALCSLVRPRRLWPCIAFMNLWGRALTPPWGRTPRKPARSSRGPVGSTARSCQESRRCLEVEKVCLFVQLK